MSRFEYWLSVFGVVCGLLSAFGLAMTLTIGDDVVPALGRMMQLAAVWYGGQCFSALINYRSIAATK